MQENTARPSSKFTLIFLSVYALVYLLSRLANLTLLPAHYDEMAQLRRLAEFVGEGHIFVGLEDNLKWFQLWLLAALSWLPASPLWIGRFTSILTGLAGGLGCYALALELYRRASVGVIAALLYLVTPFVFFYDRITMPDSLLTTFGIWTMFFSLRAIRREQYRWAVAAGLSISAASLTKLSGLAYLVIPVAALLLFAPPRDWLRRWKLMATMYLPAALGAAVLAAFLNSQNMLVYSTKVAGGSLINPALWLSNSQLVASWFGSLLTVPLLLLGLVGAGLALIRRDRAAVYALAAPVAVAAAFIAVSKTWYPRYLMPAAPALLLLGAWALDALAQRLDRFRWGRWAVIVLALALALPALVTDFWLVVDPSQAALHRDEARQYITGWANTYRLADAGAFVAQKAQHYDEIYLALNADSFIVVEGLKYYFDAPANVKIVKFAPRSGHAVQDLNAWSQQRPTFLILNMAHEKGLDEVWTNSDQFAQGQKLTGFLRPGGETGVDVYQWLSVPALAEQWAAHSAVAAPVILSRITSVPDAAGTARFEPLSQPALATADFVLLDAETLAGNALRAVLPGGAAGNWPAQLPDNWALTRQTPGNWYLFRLEDNAPPQQPAATTLANTIAFTGFDLPQREFTPGQTVEPILHWQALAAPPVDYVVFAQLIGPDGRLYAQQDAPPLLPTASWRPGQRLAASIKIPLAAEVPPGAYRLIAGLYRPGSGERLAALQADGRRWPNDAIQLAEVTVLPAQSP